MTGSITPVGLVWPEVKACLHLVTKRRPRLLFDDLEVSLPGSLFSRNRGRIVPVIKVIREVAVQMTLEIAPIPAQELRLRPG